MLQLNKIKLISILSILLLVSSAYAQVTPALAIGSISKTDTITSLSYQITVPQYPSINSTNAFEFHAGMIDKQNTTFIKSTISYGCQVSSHKACYPPFINRFIFYISIINTATLYRTQYPANGYVITSNSNYTITFTKTHCILGISAWSFSIHNNTNSFSTKVCMLSQNFTYPISGMLEIHNVTSCDTQLPPQHNFTQYNYTINSQPILNWTLLQTEPYINCNFTNTYDKNNIIIGWE